MTSETSPTATPADDQGVPGKYVVLAMLAFGVGLTGFMWLYTYFNNQPFIPLRHALVEKFKRETSPRVEGGKERGRGPSKLRIVLTVKFDPSQESPDNQKLRTGMERDTLVLANQHLDLSQYERWEFILIRYVAEAVPQRWESKREMSEVLEMLRSDQLPSDVQKKK